MSLDRQGAEQAIVTSADELVAWFEHGEKPPQDWRVGTEHEKIGVYRDSGRRVPFEGERGIAALLERIAEVDGWERTFEGDHLIALGKGGASITLEPGGQLELSGAPLARTRETARQTLSEGCAPPPGELIRSTTARISSFFAASSSDSTVSSAAKTRLMLRPRSSTMVPSPKTSAIVGPDRSPRDRASTRR